MLSFCYSQCGNIALNVLASLWKKYPFFQDLKSPGKQNGALKVLEFDVKGP